jgi:hypothetical protein
MRLPPRPRDALGRPLERDSDVAVEADPVALPPSETLMSAQRLLDAGRAFRAHEVLEAAWKAAPAGERDLWRGLAQLAVGVTHAQRGNRRGSVALLRRAEQTLLPYAGTAPYGIDVDGLRSWAADAAEAVSAGAELPAVRPLTSGRG